jgi:SNF2 family DNA or RNA helicase
VANYNQYEMPAKFKKLAALVEANAKLGRKTLIWSNFVRNLLALERQLGLYKPALAYGGLSAYSNDAQARTRATEITRFRDDADCMVLLANPAAISEGISLHHACHDAIYLDRTFNAGQYLQSLDRIHRLGLDPDQETRFTFLVTNETIDEIVDARVRIKAERLGEMIDDPNLASVALPDDEDYGDVIDDPDDLVALFAHLRGDHVP